ncbi:MAG: hypothetical protein UD936_09070 [Acutalibacteraceae bacterium]|nr:hypothetical protein [Acutalibacteraceae bacterium]
MKNIFKNVTIFVFITSIILCCTGCENEVKNNIGEPDSVKAEKLTEYPKNNAPVKTINSGDYWYSLISTYGNDDYKLSVAENPKDLNVVYEINDSSIWCFEANNDYAVWNEKRENENKLMLYKNSGSEVTEIYTVDTTNEVHLSHIGLYKNYLYYIETDYKNKSDSILRYDIKNKVYENIYSVKIFDENAIMNLSVDENYLTASVIDNDKVNIVLIDLASDDNKVVTELPENVSYVYDAAYDKVNDTYAVYYADKKDKEHTGIFNNKMKEIKNVVTFNENVYAYQDSIECYDGHLYWIFQVNASGNVSDHYQLVDYNYIEDKPKEYERTFYFNRTNDSIYALSFDKSGDYQNIVLDKYNLKPESYNI